MRAKIANLLGQAVGWGIIGTLTAAYFTHIYVCLVTGQGLLLIAGAISIIPAWIHGIFCWFGYIPGGILT